VTRSQAPRRRPAAQEGTDGSVGVSGGCVAPDASSVPFSASQDVLLSAMNEREFQQHVREGLEARGWLVFVVPDMRRTRAGLPDIIAVHPRLSELRLLAWELKTQRGKVRADQERVLAALRDVPGIDARVVRPSDWMRLKERI
jgi:hypothetical protein